MMSHNTYDIKAGWLIDGSGGPIRKDQIISIKAGCIADIRDTNPENDTSSNLTDLSRHVILPALIDSHVHLCMSGSVDHRLREKQLVADYDELEPVIAEHLRHHFSHGILAVRDGGDRLGFVLRYLRDHQDSAPGPVLVHTPGIAYHSEGRYGSLIGAYPAENESLLQAFNRLNQKTKLVKLVNSGLNSLTHVGVQTDPQFTAEQLRELISQAKEKGCSVMVHANGELPVKMAIEAGCDSIEHGFFMGRENVELMADKGIFWVPTTITMKAFADSAEFYSKNIDSEVVEKNLALQLEQLAYAKECGVNIALGTDSGSIGVLHGESLVEEMKLFMKAGFSLSRAINCATECGAKLLGIDDRLGMISKGKPANFLVARGTPAQLPRKLTYLEAIYLDGEPSPLYRRDPDYTNLRKSQSR